MSGASALKPWGRSGVWALAWALGALGVAAVAGLVFGAVSDLDLEWVWRLRLPRVALAAAVGAALAVAGAALQVVFSNPLCDPFTLGVSSGATLGAAVLSSFAAWRGFADWGGVAGGALAGALVFSGIIQLLARSRAGTGLQLLLAGVMLNLVGSSLMTLWMALADPAGVQAAIYWLLGDLSRARAESAAFAAVATVTLVSLLWRERSALDAFLLGEDGARALGVEVRASRARVLLFSSLLTAVAVGSVGMVGFVGLVVPHFVRLRSGALHGRFLPLCAVWGATALVASDLIARTVAPPTELPVGIVTALVGAPVFMSILLRRRREAGDR